MRLNSHAVVLAADRRQRPGLLFLLTIQTTQWLGAGHLCQIPDNKIQDSQGVPQEAQLSRTSPANTRPKTAKRNSRKPLMMMPAAVECSDKPEKY
ncbi:MAG: hypothetical protein COB58_06260 [Thalassobium sp.]|nr:MAG: hypothetical protein COB58_06260 [Thalassobium sp.]|tara:strand:- start:45 stop:329 length:285 start_codon:yes stop_codon:yes gene_type:complete